MTLLISVQWLFSQALLEFEFFDDLAGHILRKTFRNSKTLQFEREASGVQSIVASYVDVGLFVKKQDLTKTQSWLSFWRMDRLKCQVGFVRKHTRQASIVVAACHLVNFFDGVASEHGFLRSIIFRSSKSKFRTFNFFWTALFALLVLGHESCECRHHSNPQTR